MAACTKEQCLQQGVITTKTFLQNKKLLIAVVVEILFELYGVVGNVRLFVMQGNISHCLIRIILFFVELIGLSLVIGAFVCNFNGKVRPAIVCAASALAIKLITCLAEGYLYSPILLIDDMYRLDILSFLPDILFLLPEVALLVFMIIPKDSLRPWSFIAWGAVFFPVILSLISTHWWTLWDFVQHCLAYIPLGFVYFFGFTDKRNAVCPQTAAKRTTTTPYLDEYKRNRLHGGK